MHNRRDFIKASGLALAAWPLSSLADRSRLLLATNPTFGLFFGSDRIEELRDLFQTSPIFEGLRTSLLETDREAERRFLESEIRYNDHLYDIAHAARLAENMAFLYAMTEDEDAGNLSADAIRAIMKFPRWDYFLEGGTKVFGLQRAPASTIATSLASDWLGDLVDAAERESWLRTMGERGCEACFTGLYGMRYKDRVKGWSMDTTSTYFEHRPDDIIDMTNWPYIIDRTNLKAVPASALAVGAIAYELQFGPSDDTARWIEQAIFSLGTFEQLFAKDGSYDEGVSYANYTTSHLAQAFDILSKFDHARMQDVINWPGFADYMFGLSMPTAYDSRAIVNFCDAGGGMISAVPYWIARHLGDAQSQWFGTHLSRDHDKWSLIWYDPSIEEQAPAEGPTLYRSDLDWIVARTGYEADDLVVGMRSGGPSNHEHADRNAILIKCYGEQLVTDPYRPPYSYADPSWMMRTTAGHSALLIDGRGHQYHDGSEGTNASNAVAEIIGSGEREHVLFWTSDATPAYKLVNDDILSVTRTILVLHELPAVIVLDKVLKETIPSIISARYFGYNLDGKGKLRATGDRFSIERPLANLKAKAFASGSALCSVGRLPIEEERAGQHPFVDATAVLSSTRPFLATVLVPESAGEPTSTIEVLPRGLDALRILVKGRRGGVEIDVVDAGAVPEWEIQ